MFINGGLLGKKLKNVNTSVGLPRQRRWGQGWISILVSSLRHGGTCALPIEKEEGVAKDKYQIQGTVSSKWVVAMAVVPNLCLF